ncbi:MAG TPA: UDP-N-acetylmuramoyl-L-alanyl-D-glutamate--2,6-diaminopimelate ligase, partial [Actinomycetota bacterium]
ARVAHAERVIGDPATALREVVADSREVGPGALFCCVPGHATDGHGFAAEAAAAGAAALLVERELPIDLPQAVVRSVRASMGPVAAVVFGDPARAMTMLGVTGTNGKTTITYLLEAAIREAGGVPGVIGTTGAHVAGAPEPLARTTPEAPDLHRLLRRMRVAGVDTVAMEVSSHALDQHRVDGVRFDAAVFTNLSQDHLDYHPSMEAYFAAKARLFTPALAHRGAVNIDDPWGARLAGDAGIEVLTFAEHGPADLRATDVRVDPSGVSFRVEGIAVRSPLRGAFNVSNVLAALACSRLAGLDLAAAARGLAGVEDVPGRMEPVEEGQDFLAVVDYAHTPDSIRSVLRGARPLTTGRVIVVFGCGGDRDRAKRPLMGRAATELADLTVLTTDNPRSEDPLAILGEIERGARAGGGEYLVEADRRAAIAIAVEAAAPGDVVIVAGKGHETVQELATEAVPFDDRAVLRHAIRAVEGGS